MNQFVNCVLLVDDNENDNFIHKRVIKKNGRVENVRVASDGLKALDYLQNLNDYKDPEENPRPNIIFLDINMPKMNGFEFLQAYKELEEGQKAEICIVMLTTSLNPDDLQKTLQIGEAQKFQHKPMTHEILNEVIDSYWEFLKNKN